MKKLFADLPEAIENTTRILDKVENYVLYRDVLLPEFGIPQEFESCQRIYLQKEIRNTYVTISKNRPYE